MLVIEDGTMVEGANSYDSLANIRAYALARGITLDEDDDIVDSQVILAMDFIESKRSQFQGSKTYTEQELQFPRTNVFVDDVEISDVSIPKILKQALAQTVLQIQQTPELMPTLEGFAVKRRKVDVIETEFATGGSQTGLAFPVVPTFTKIDALLKPLFKGSFILTVVRV